LHQLAEPDLSTVFHGFEHPEVVVGLEYLFDLEKGFCDLSEVADENRRRMSICSLYVRTLDTAAQLAAGTDCDLCWWVILGRLMVRQS
jgi:hypothetical protein